MIKIIIGHHIIISSIVVVVVVVVIIISGSGRIAVIDVTSIEIGWLRRGGLIPQISIHMGIDWCVVWDSSRGRMIMIMIITGRRYRSRWRVVR